MKNIFNLIFTIAIVLGFSMTSFARNPAAGDDPNAVIDSHPESGTMVLGTDTKKGFCRNCQNRNNLKLSDNKDNFIPGFAPSQNAAPAGDGKTQE